MRNRIFGLGVCLATTSALAGSGSEGTVPAGARALKEIYPGVRVQMVDGQVRAIYGAEMSQAADPALAAQWWLDDHADAFGVADLELQLARVTVIGHSGLFTVYAYDQTMDGVPVEFGLARVLVNTGSVNSVTLATGRLAIPPVDGFEADTIGDADALEIVQDTHEHLTVWNEPTLVIFDGWSDGAELSAPVRAWKIRGENTLQGDDFEAYSFFVNAANGDVVYARNEVYHTDITGTAHGMATPWGPPDGMYPDDTQNPPADFILEDVQLLVVGGSTTNANDDGTFTIPNGGTGAVTVNGKLIGPWANVIDDTGPEHVISATVTPPGPWDAFFNPAPTEVLTAQVNAMIHATNTHDFMTDHQPGFTNLNQIQAHVNQSSTCNAFYSGNTINFYKKGGGCPNTAYSSVVSHEYGHYVVNQLGLSQNAFGEGVGDIIGDLMYDDPMTGRDFLCEGCILRNPIASNKQFPCNGEIHECGMVLSGVWWDINLNLTPVLGDAEALEYVQQLWTDWMMVTVGQHDSNDPIGPTSAIEVLSLSDPAYDAEICSAFDKHSIDCPGPLDCNDINNFVGKCANGTLRVKIRLADSSHDGETLTIQVDSNTPVDLTVNGDRAVYSLTGQSGSHTVSLLAPAGCESPLSITCQ